MLSERIISQQVNLNPNQPIEPAVRSRFRNPQPLNCNDNRIFYIARHRIHLEGVALEVRPYRDGYSLTAGDRIGPL
jgi:hypothetical protein